MKAADEWRLLSLLKYNQETHRRWKQGQATWSEYRGVVRINANQTIKASAQLDLNLAKDVKHNNKGLFKYINNRRQKKDNVGSLLNGDGTLLREIDEKAESLSAFASVFTGRTRLQGSRLRRPG